MPLRASFLSVVVTYLLCSVSVAGGDSAAVLAEKWFKAGQERADKTHYLEAIEQLEEAEQILEAASLTETPLYGDVLFALAETKIKARLHQGFPAHYVKTALRDVQACNKLRERLTGTVRQKLAEGFYIEGYIQKNFFKRLDEAMTCFEKAVSADPGNSAAKVELSELMTSDGQE